MAFNMRDLARRAFLIDAPDDAAAALSPLAARARLVRLGPGAPTAHIGDAVCTIGAFDGVHRGHRFLFARTRDDAARRGLPSVVLTFDPDPDELFLPASRVHKLLNNEDRLEYLRSFGTDYVVSVPFTRDLAANTAASFLRDVVGPVFRPRAIHVGTDFRLGANNAGNVAELRSLGTRREAPCEVFGYDLLCNESEPVSATRIRTMLRERGDCAGALHLLGRPHFVRGTVVHGRRQGREFGFPTANVELSYPYEVPAEGVYAGIVRVGGLAWPAAVNVGVPRTFAGEEGCASIEAHLLGFAGDVYGREVSVAFVERLRGQQTFASLDELMATVNGNIDWVARNLGRAPVAL
jgi:riboflavin kinase/FMN adenylyltransferase